MTTGGKPYYLTDALDSVITLAQETGSTVNEYCHSPRGTDVTFTERAPIPTGASAASRAPPAPTPPARRRIRTRMPKAAPSTAPTP
ncbi:hypothetical protein GCM10018987_09640 [Streptomyces cremeus]